MRSERQENQTREASYQSHRDDILERCAMIGVLLTGGDHSSPPAAPFLLCPSRPPPRTRLRPWLRRAFFRPLVSAFVRPAAPGAVAGGRLRQEQKSKCESLAFSKNRGIINRRTKRE